MFQRKTAPRVKNGRVQKKDRRALSPDYFYGETEELIIDRKRPGEGYAHVLNVSDVRRFIGILPDWNVLTVGLKAVVLDAGDDDTMGWHFPGVVAICAWPRDLWQKWDDEFFKEHRPTLERIGVEVERRSHDYLCKFSDRTAAAFQLLHILPHELGHHHDRMTTRTQEKAARGEDYAEQYALRYEEAIFDAYATAFGL